MLHIADRNLVFLHIPKNAGQAVRNAILDVADPDYAPIAKDLAVEAITIPALADQVLDIPGLGALQIEHLDLRSFREHFPSCFDVIGKAKSFVMIRQPRDRFISALMQRLGEHKDIKSLRIDDPIVLQEARHVCDWLEQGDPSRNTEYVHFCRQVNYTDLDGVRIINALFPLDRIGSAATWIERETGLKIDVKRDHVRREPKKWARRIQPAARFIGRRIIPLPIKRAIYPLWKGSAVFSDAAGRYDSLSLGATIEGFIADYYADDARLYREACAFCDEQDKAR